MQADTRIQSARSSSLKTYLYKCPCQENKNHLGISQIIPKPGETTPSLKKVQKKFFLGHGIKTSDPVIAADIFLERDHRKLKDLLRQYYHGKLGVYIVPPMFFGQVAEAVCLSEYTVPKHLDKVRGDIAEQAVYFGFKKYYESTGDDVLIIHSHKFLNKAGNNEKDFIVFNLNKGEEYFS